MFIYFYKLDIISILLENRRNHYFIITLPKIFVLTFLSLFCLPHKQPNFLASCIILEMNYYQIFHYWKLSVLKLTHSHLKSFVICRVFVFLWCFPESSCLRPECFIFNIEVLSQRLIKEDHTNYRVWIQSSGSIYWLWDHPSGVSQDF